MPSVLSTVHWSVLGYKTEVKDNNRLTRMGIHRPAVKLSVLEVFDSILFPSEFSLNTFGTLYRTLTSIFVTEFLSTNSQRGIPTAYFNCSLRASKINLKIGHVSLLRLTVPWSHHFVQWCTKWSNQPSEKSAYSDSSRYDSRRLNLDVDLDDFMITIITYWGRYGTYQNILLMYTQ